MSVESVGIEIVEKNDNTNALIKAVNKLATELEKSAGSSDKSTRSTKQLGNANQEAAGKVTHLGSAIGQTTTGFNRFQGAAATALGALSVGKLLGYADTFTNIENKMRLATRGQDQLNAGMRNAFGIAQETRTKFEDVAGVYGKVTTTLRNMNRPASDAAAITKTIAQAVAISGTSAEAAANGLRQFEQGLSAGALRGDEFNSVIENTPGLALAIAEGMGVPLGSLRALAAAGTLTSEQLINALTKASSAVGKSFQSMTPTIQQAWIVIENATINYLGTVNKATSFTGILATTMIGLANNINVVVPALVALGVAVATVGISFLVGQVASLAIGFTTLLASIGPLTLAVGAFVVANGLLIAGIGAAVAAIYLLWPAIKIAGEYVLAFGQAVANVMGYGPEFATGVETIKAGFTRLGAEAESLTNTFKTALKPVLDYAKGLGDVNGQASGTSKSLAELNKLSQQTGKDYNQFGEVIERTTKKMVEADSTYSAATRSMNILGTQIGGTSSSYSGLTKAANDNTTAIRSNNDVVAMGIELQRNYSAALATAYQAAVTLAAAERDRAAATQSAAAATQVAATSQASYNNAQTAGISISDVGSGSEVAGSGTQGYYDEKVGVVRGNLGLADVAPYMSNAEFKKRFGYERPETAQNFGVDSYAAGMKLGNAYGERDIESQLRNSTGRFDEILKDIGDKSGFTIAKQTIEKIRKEDQDRAQSTSTVVASGPTPTNNRPIQITINTPDANSFRQSQKQLETDAFRQLVRAVS